MKWISHNGEHLWAGQLGHTLVVLSFVLSWIGFFLFRSRNPEHIRLGKIFLFLKTFSVFSIAGLLIFMLFAKYFEYQYVWQHSNRRMDMHFVLSCLWEGQEGSFLLWICWNALTALIFFHQSKADERTRNLSLSLIMLIQSFLLSMILGVYVGSFRIGSSPFLLLREHPDFMNLPFLMNEEYLKNLDGRGLNPLLMNYWMVIHPPILFLGFSLSMIPFVYLTSVQENGIQNYRYTDISSWVWLAAAVLGAGILMGGAWAYESLSFGGFWAWDPVENSSLVPWMMLVAGGHLMLIHHRRGKWLLTGVLITSLSFLFVLYSTFLTRSGILGNASVHSFTDLGMQGQLVTCMLFFLFYFTLVFIPSHQSIYRWAYGILCILICYFSILYNHPETGLYAFLLLTILAWILAGKQHRHYEIPDVIFFSREYQMFLGTLLFFSLSLLIIFFTSLPVLNRLAGTSFASPKPYDYTIMSIPFIVPVLLMMSYTQSMKYKSTNLRTWLGKNKIFILITLAAGFSAGIPLFFTGNAAGFSLKEKISYLLVFLSALYAFIGNTGEGFRSQWKTKGVHLTHLGFALLVLGALISVSKKSVISQNVTSTNLKDLGKNYDNRSASLMKQGDTVPMGPYRAVFVGKKREKTNVFFQIDFFSFEKNNAIEKFTLYPKVQDNPVMGKAADPDTKHFLTKDIYAYVSYADLSDNNFTRNDFSQPRNYISHLKDTITLNNCMIIPDSIYHRQIPDETDTTLRVFMKMKVINESGNTFHIFPYLDIKHQSIFSDFHTDTLLGLMINFWKINPSDASFEFIIREDLHRKKDFIVVEAIIFPGINLLWAGCILMTTGLLLAALTKHRSKAA